MASKNRTNRVTKTTLEVTLNDEEPAEFPVFEHTTFRVILWGWDDPGTQYIVDVAECQNIPGQSNAVSNLRKFIENNGGQDLKPAAFRQAHAKAEARFNQLRS